MVAIALILAAGCSAPTDAPVTVLAGAYNAVSINGNSLPVETSGSGDGVKQEIIADRLWIGGAAGKNGVLWRIVLRTTKGSAVRVDSSTATGSFEATLATAQTTFGPVSASGRQLTLKATDGTTRVYIRAD
jgi:hypothetical protein